MATEHELPEFAELAAILRKGRSDVVDESPAPSLWAAIEAAVEAEEGRGPAPVLHLAERRRIRARRIAVVVAAVAAVVLVGIPVSLALRDTGPTPVTATLAALEGFQGSGRAELVGRELDVALEGLEPVEGESYELWLLDLVDGELNDLRSLGTIDVEGRFEIAQDVDLSDYNVVDVSLEPHDGNPDHSGVSVLRGELPSDT